MRLPVVCLLGIAAAWPCMADDVPGGLRMDQIQVIGTHNSYHLRPSAGMLRLAKWATEQAMAWEYDHAPLDVQLERGVRHFELDMHPYPEGWEVFHAPIFDENTTCRRFVDCLAAVKAWSDAHPRHMPVGFLLEIKQEESKLSPRRTAALDAAALDRMDAEIRSVFPRERIVTPDLVREDAPTLTEAVRTRGWPQLDAVRGKAYFVLHERGALRGLYAAGRASLAGRVMFVNSDPSRDDFAFAVLDNPHHPKIEEYARQNVIVRVRADAGLDEGRENDTRGRDAALASAAHIVSTDFPPGEADPGTGYLVALPGGAAARPNPVTAAPAAGDPPLE